LAEEAAVIVPLLLAIDFLNFTYVQNPCSANVPVGVVMRKGSFSYADARTGTDFDLNVHSVKEGSLKDGTRQAVVILACDFPIGGTAAAYVFDERRSGAVLLARVGDANWGGDWGRGPDSIHLRFAKHFLYVDQCKDSECTRDVAMTYALRSGKLIKVFAQTDEPHR
jgi:hypothetical protein